MVEKDILKPALRYTFSQHLFTGNWQAMMFSQIKSKLASDSVIPVLDFAKNRGIKYQDEIKSAYYTHQSITMHPIVSYYKCSTHLKRESIVVISEDNNHDFHAVNHYMNIVNTEIKEDFKRRIIFSDGCSSQYKSKGPFSDLALFKIPINRNFFGSEHGKSECDGEIGIVNRAIDRAIIGNKVIINNAEDLFKFCQKSMYFTTSTCKGGTDGDCKAVKL
ncbi:Hypothetical predicted protein [Mytilus galloprovincialis]|uniref:Uncharacterized protein n=1 Tax=Mytilus galloprovincialis TaxID=29158 RepID=A0A8B6CSS3_MYTGA|nr:Hypothetical predicted protein [Mytilus galloprovincialis]